MRTARRLVALLALAAVAMMGAPATAGQGIDATIAMPYGGQVRTFNLYVAPRVPTRTPVPLLFVLHGLYNDPATAEASTGLDTVADTRDVAVVYPAGINSSWNAGNCCGDAHAQQSDDVGFLVQVLQMVEQIRPIDLDRVYIAGFSNGGMMALRAECERPDVFAAAVSVSGPLEAPCAGGPRPVSAMIVHGQRDTTVPYDGQRHSRFLGVPLASAPESAATLAQRSDCVANRRSGAKRYVRMQYVGCLEGSSVQLVTVPAMGHRWPNLQHDGIDGGALAWTFLTAQQRRG